MTSESYIRFRKDDLAMAESALSKLQELLIKKSKKIRPHVSAKVSALISYGNRTKEGIDVASLSADRLSNLKLQQEDVDYDHDEVLRIPFDARSGQMAKDDLILVGFLSASVDQLLYTAMTSASFKALPQYRINLTELAAILNAHFDDQCVGRGIDVDYHEGIASDAFYHYDPDEPTTYLQRFQCALARLCGDRIPDRELCRLWLEEDNDEANLKLQDWTSSNTTFNWAMGIGTIEAAMTLAQNPIEGVNHE